MNKINVVVSAMWYPVTMAMWFTRALARRKDVNLYRVGHFTGTWIPWGGGMHLPIKYMDVPDIIIPPSPSNSVKPDFLKGKLPEIDLWIEADAGWHFSSRPPCKVHALIKTDPHVLSEQYKSIENRVDISFGMQRAYLQPNDYYLPYAYDPTVHYPMYIEKEYDACLIGLMYDHRNRLIQLLKEQGLNVYYDLGKVFDEYRVLYNKSKVALSWSSLNDTPARCFEGMAMGLPLVCNITPEMRELFEPEIDFLSFSTASEGRDRVIELLNDNLFASQIAKSGYDKVKPHTWDSRVETILSVV